MSSNLVERNKKELREKYADSGLVQQDIDEVEYESLYELIDSDEEDINRDIESEVLIRSLKSKGIIQ